MRSAVASLWLACCMEGYLMHREALQACVGSLEAEAEPSQLQTPKSPSGRYQLKGPSEKVPQVPSALFPGGNFWSSHEPGLTSPPQVSHAAPARLPRQRPVKTG